MQDYYQPAKPPSSLPPVIIDNGEFAQHVDRQHEAERFLQDIARDLANSQGITGQVIRVHVSDGTEINLCLNSEALEIEVLDAGRVIGRVVEGWLSIGLRVAPPKDDHP